MNKQAGTKVISVRVAEWMADKIADAIAVYDLQGLTSMADYFVMCTARSTTQCQAIADYLVESLSKKFSEKPIGIEGYENGRWILLDLGAIVIHIFCPEEREYYDLDGLWADAPLVNTDEAETESVGEKKSS